MTGLKRPLAWYASWMVGDDATQTTRSVLADLQSAVQGHIYDSQTLEEIILILDHECLCWKSEDGLGLSLRQNIRNVLQHRLETSHTDELIVQLSACLVRSINPASHYIRELQARGLVSALALLHAQGVRALQADFHESLRAQFDSRFQDLLGLPDGPDTFSVEVFRRVQCSYFLCLGAEYAKQFVQARPIVLTALSRAVSLILVGISIATSVLGGQPGNLQSTLQTLDGALRPLWTSPTDLFQALCSLQELTRITGALSSYSKVVLDSDQTLHEIARICSRDLATKLLNKILALFNSYPKFQVDVRPTSIYTEYFLAFFNRGPADFGHYLYFYGLLDCASQLSRFLGNEELPPSFRAKLDKIISETTEPSYRWKAIEILLRDPENRTLRARRIVDAATQNPNPTAELRSRLQTEVRVICEFLNEEDGFSSRRSSTVPGPDPPDIPPEEELSPIDWVERPLRVFKISPHGQKWTLFSRRGLFSRKQFLSAGLSPDCVHVYFMSKREISIYRLDTLKRGHQEAPVFRMRVLESTLKKAALSDRFLVILKDGLIDAMDIYRYGGQAQSKQPVGAPRFETTSNQHRWDSNCLAIHESSDRVWIAVGGRINQGGRISSSIKMYQIDVNDQTMFFSRHDAHFTRSEPNWLASDFLKMIAFGPQGGRLVCLTNKNIILVWLLSNNARPIEAPFRIAKGYALDMNADGVTSATLLQTPTTNTYVLCTTSPSRERATHNGEWSFISPVAASPAHVPPELDHSLWRLGKAGAIVAGAASPGGDVIALLEDSTKILLMPLVANEAGGLESKEPILLDAKLAKQKEVCPTSIRFTESNQGLVLVAVDTSGQVVEKHLGRPLGMTSLQNGHQHVSQGRNQSSINSFSSTQRVSEVKYSLGAFSFEDHNSSINHS